MCLAFLSFTKSFGQVGIGTVNPHPSSILDLDASSLPANEKVGFLPPRITTSERNAINGSAPAEGLVIYNTTAKCLQFWDGSAWYNICDNSYNGVIPSNTNCETATISATPCSAAELSGGINGGSLGNKYANGAGGTYSVVQIGNQCWMAENIDVNPSGSPVWVNSSDEGWYGYYENTYQAAGEGTLMQWSAAMAGDSTERAQGVCPTGWHVPSDCEWMYLENELAMTVIDQQAFGWRGTDQGTQLKNGGSSGFNALLSGYRNPFNGGFSSRGQLEIWYSSTDGIINYQTRRALANNEAGVARTDYFKSEPLFVRCIKD